MSDKPAAEPLSADTGREFWEALNIGIPGPYLPFEQLPEQQRAMLRTSAEHFNAALRQRLAEVEEELAANVEAADLQFRIMRKLEERAIDAETEIEHLCNEGLTLAVSGWRKRAEAAEGKLASAEAKIDELVKLRNSSVDRANVAEQRLAEAEALVGDMIPYAQATIGLPRPAWPYDNVILRAERLFPNPECLPEPPPAPKVQNEPAESRDDTLSEGGD